MIYFFFTDITYFFIVRVSQLHRDLPTEELTCFVNSFLEHVQDMCGYPNNHADAKWTIVSYWEVDEHSSKNMKRASDLVFKYIM